MVPAVLASVEHGAPPDAEGDRPNSPTNLPLPSL
jgi:hypothetical protein